MNRFKELYLVDRVPKTEDRVHSIIQEAVTKISKEKNSEGKRWSEEALHIAEGRARSKQERKNIPN